MQQEMDQVSLYGFDTVKQQFNQVVNTYKSMVDNIKDIDTTHIVQYQQLLTNNKTTADIEEAIRLNVAHDKGRTFPLILRDTSGTAVTNNNGEIVHYPAGFDLKDMLKQAEGLPSKEFPASDTDYVLSEDLYYKEISILNLYNFKHFGEWDLQRWDLPAKQKIRPEFIDISTIAIGMYGAKAGIPEPLMLGIENTYAMRNSDIQDRDDVWKYLGKRNVGNTKIGYILIKDHKIKG